MVSGQDEALRRMEGAPRYNAWLLDRARPHLGRRVIDAGAGVGTFTEPLAALCAEVVAAEPDPALRAQLERRVGSLGNVAVVAAGAAELAAAAGATADAIVCFNVLEHIPDDVAALRGFHAALVPGGRLLILVPAHPALFGEVDRTVEHERRYTRSGLRAALEGVGFEVQELAHVNPVGALGWLLSSRILRRKNVPVGPLALFDRLVPVLRLLDRLRLPVGLSLWAVARRR